MKQRLLFLLFLILISTRFLFSQTKLVAGIEEGVTPVFQPLNTQAVCDTVFSFPTVDEFPSGITSDGNFIWCNTANLDYIYKYSFSGLLIDSILNPASLFTLPGGDLDFDGTNLLVMVEEADTLYKINPNTGAVVSRFKVAPCTQNCDGVAFDGTYIWVNDYFQSFIYKLNALTGAVINSFPFSTPSYMLPIKFINGRLYGLSLFPGKLHEIDTSSGNIISTVPWCLGYPLGFCKINNHVWGVSSDITSGGTQRIYQFDSLFMTSFPFYLPENNSFEVFPNPSSEKITVSFPGNINKSTIVVNNVFGEIVYAESFYNKSKKEINIKNFSSGIYFVKVFDGKKYFCSKIIIEQN
jgi:hypothetical protein